MKILIAILLFFVLNASSYMAGRLDTFRDIGYLTPKNVFQINENIYFRTYFDIINETVTDISAKTFSVNFWNGSRVDFYKNDTYLPYSNTVYLIIGDRPNDFVITIVMNLNADVFSVDSGTQQYVNFILDLSIKHSNTEEITYYSVSSQIQIQNNVASTTTTTTTTTTGNNDPNPSESTTLAASFFTLFVLLIIIN